jgi:hypothetical protein
VTVLLAIHSVVHELEINLGPYALAIIGRENFFLLLADNGQWRMVNG